MLDTFASVGDSPSSPARALFRIVPHATDALAILPKAIRADTAGTVTLRAIDSTADVTLTLAAGEVVAVRAQFVRAAGTTASLHGLA